jgi:hypothetical protein
MDLREDINRIKQVMGVLYDNETYDKGFNQLLEEDSDNNLTKNEKTYCKRRISLGDYDMLMTKRKLTAFTPNHSVDSHVGNTINLFIEDSLREDMPDEEYLKCYYFLKDYFYGVYEDELTEYFEHKKEKYDNRVPSRERYIFVKHDKPYEISGWRGFTESFDYYDDLVNKFGTWIDVDWDKIKDKLDNMDDYRKEGEWFYGRPLRIKNIGDEGNRWGYNFSIIKMIDK